MVVVGGPEDVHTTGRTSLLSLEPGTQAAAEGQKQQSAAFTTLPQDWVPVYTTFNYSKHPNIDAV